MITITLQALGIVLLSFAFWSLVVILPTCIVLTYEIATSVFTTSYHSTHLATRVTSLICAIIWDALLFIAAYILLLTVLIDFDSIGST